jgi:hypothetical protein
LIKTLANSPELLCQLADISLIFRMRGNTDRTTRAGEAAQWLFAAALYVKTLIFRLIFAFIAAGKYWV